MVFVACHDDDDDDIKPENNAGEDTENIHLDPNIPIDKNIKIDENSSFNMRHFITSLNQISILEHNSLYYDHHYYDNGLAKESFIESRCFGEFKQKIKKFVHNYDPNGVIVSSNVYPLDEEQDRISKNRFIVYNYVYDKDGYIIEMHRVEGDSQDDSAWNKYIYDEKKVLTEVEIYDNSEEPFSKFELKYLDYENFTHANYDNVPLVSKLTFKNLQYEYSYEDDFFYNDKNLLIRVEKTNTYTTRESEPNISTFEYDDKNRLANTNEYNQSFKKIYKYSDELLSMDELDKDDDLYMHTAKYDKEFFQVSSCVYYYDSDDSTLDYAVSKVYDKEYCESEYYRIEYYDGEAINLNLLAYAVLNREESKNKHKQVDYFDSSNNLTYSKVYLDEGGFKILNNKGEEINESSISEPWYPQLSQKSFMIYEVVNNMDMYD
jgi:hypothetical protein